MTGTCFSVDKLRRPSLCGVVIMVLVCVVMVVVHIDIDLEVTHTPPSEHATKLHPKQYSHRLRLKGAEVQQRWPPENVDRLSNTSMLLALKSPNYIKNLTNPCWYERLSSPRPYKGSSMRHHFPQSYVTKMTSLWRSRMNGLQEPLRMRCLPYFYLIGQPKSGTTDLFYKLNMHPDIAMGTHKEPHWWTRKRFEHPSEADFSGYLDVFDYASETVRASYTSQTNQKQIVIGEGSASTFWDNRHWRHQPENHSPMEPDFITPHYISHIQPKAKFIVILRNPVDRIYSEYLYFHKNSTPSAEEFHNVIVRNVKEMKRCAQGKSLRACAYDPPPGNKARLHVGMYSIYLSDWFKVVPRDNIHVLTLEEYSSNRTQHLQQLCTFLELDPKILPSDISSSNIANERRKSDRRVGEMRPDTRGILREFYSQFNKDLAELLQDEQYLW